MGYYENKHYTAYQRICKIFIGPCMWFLSSWVYPKELKWTNVLPVFKAKGEMIFTSYRAVSVLHVLSKMLKIDACWECNIYQWKNHSTNISLGPRMTKLHTWLYNINWTKCRRHRQMWKCECYIFWIFSGFPYCRAWNIFSWTSRVWSAGYSKITWLVV